MSNPKSVKNYALTLTLTIIFGFLVIHRFYVGKVGTGVLYLFTAGLLGFGWIIDIFTVAFGNFTDKTNAFIRP
jgi:TM2 domain-containing membrane protein YozV